MKRAQSLSHPAFFQSSGFVGCLLLLFFAVLAQATDRRVPTTTYPTIASAVADAQPGDRILVGAGTYQENVVSTNANLQFIGRKAIWDGTLSNGTPGVCLIASGGGTVIRGFSFRAGQANASQVQLTGDNCSVIKCVSRGPSARFLTIVGNGTVVDSCSLFSVNSSAIQIFGDGAVVKKLKTLQCDDDVVFIQGNGATVTGCMFRLTEDSFSVDVAGNNAVVMLNHFVNCDSGVNVNGTNAAVAKNQFMNCSSAIRVTGSGLVENNKTIHAGVFSLTGSNLTARGNTFTAITATGDGVVVEHNKSLQSGRISVTGDNLAIRGNVISSAPNDTTGIVANSRTSAGGGVIEDNKLTEISQTGLDIRCSHVVIQRNHVTDAGTENSESGCAVSGDFNTLVDNVVIGGGTHAFDISGSSNSLTNCSAVDAAADGFHITGDNNTLTGCEAMLCTGEGLDNGGDGTLVTQCVFKHNRIDVANDGTFANQATFTTDNAFFTGGIAQPSQVD